MSKNIKLGSDQSGGLRDQESGAQRRANRELARSVSCIKEMMATGNVDFLSLMSDLDLETPKDSVTSKIVKLPSGDKLFTLKKYKSEDIESNTKVSPRNPRFHDVITDADLQDLVRELDGQSLLNPCWAYTDPLDSKDAFFDGGRRRRAIPLCNFPPMLEAWVTEEELTEQDLHALLAKFDIQKKRTAVEQGVYWSKLKDDYSFTNVQVSVFVGVSVKTVEANLKLAKVDHKILALAPSPSNLGKVLIQRLVKIHDDCDFDEFNELLRLRDNELKANISKYSVVNPDLNLLVDRSDIDESSYVLPEHANKVMVDFLDTTADSISSYRIANQKNKSDSEVLHDLFDIQNKNFSVKAKDSGKVKTLRLELPQVTSDLLMTKITDIIKEELVVGQLIKPD